LLERDLSEVFIDIV